MSKPLIGITASRDINKSGYHQFRTSESYVKSLSDAGAIPVIIPLGLPEPTIHALLARMDGVLFSGGGDIAPERYGGSSNDLVGDVDPDRDHLEFRLLESSMSANKPFLGICRGLQVINVALGGSLYEDISDQHPDAIQHRYYPGWPREHLAHPVRIKSGSQLAQIIGSTDVQVNSLHHQGVNRLAPSLIPSAFAPDGIIEAVELPGYPFGLAVQWHPENLQAYTAMVDLFRVFVEACADFRDR